MTAVNRHEDFHLRKLPCKHVIAARLVRERDGGATVPNIVTDAVPRRPTYRQNWPAYNLAQTTEKHRFLVLLHDLCRGVEDFPQKRVSGRQRVRDSDAVFAACFKVCSTVSTRRFSCDLQDAYDRGHVTHPIHYNSICAYLENEELTPRLKELITQSSLPLKAIETTFAPDSTGFSASRFVRWYDEKYGTERSGHDWVKAHLITGVKTNIVTAIEILGLSASDNPQFKSLVEATAKNFKIDELTADKGYLSRENLELADGMGAAVFIPFKSNSTAGEAGTIWERMFLLYSLRREEFLKKYHQRSNVESTVNMIKSKFRDHVSSRVMESPGSLRCSASRIRCSARRTC